MIAYAKLYRLVTKKSWQGKTQTVGNGDAKRQHMEMVEKSCGIGKLSV
jgi:hypothetical protein